MWPESSSSSPSKNFICLLNLLGQWSIELETALFRVQAIINPRLNYSNFFSIISFLDTFLLMIFRLYINLWLHAKNKVASIWGLLFYNMPMLERTNLGPSRNNFSIWRDFVYLRCDLCSPWNDTWVNKTSVLTFEGLILGMIMRNQRLRLFNLGSYELIML